MAIHLNPGWTVKIIPTGKIATIIRQVSKQGNLPTYEVVDESGIQGVVSASDWTLTKETLAQLKKSCGIGHKEDGLTFKGFKKELKKAIDKFNKRYVVVIIDPTNDAFYGAYRSASTKFKITKVYPNSVLTDVNELKVYCGEIDILFDYER